MILDLTDFLQKNKEINELFMEILGEDAVAVNRKTRILFKGKYFDYPLTPINALFGLGIFESISWLLIYICKIKSRLKISNIENFEDWVIDRFGKKLFSNFLKILRKKSGGRL